MTSTQLTHYNKRCAELMGIELHYYSGETNMIHVNKKMVSLNDWAKFDSDWNQQIPVWQKIVSIIDDIIDVSVNETVIMLDEFEQSYYLQIRQGTPQSAFAILCQAIDFIDNQSKQPIK